MRRLHLLALFIGVGVAQSTKISNADSSLTTTTDAKSATPITEYVYGAQNSANLYAASVITADQSSTVLAVACSTGYVSCTTGVAFTLTQAPISLYVYDATTIGSATDGLRVICELDGTTSVACEYSFFSTSGDFSTSNVIFSTYTGDDIPHATVVITAGQEKLAAASTVPQSSFSDPSTGSTTSTATNSAMTTSKTLPQTSPSHTDNGASSTLIGGQPVRKGMLLTIVGSAFAVFAFAVLL